MRHEPENMTHLILPPEYIARVKSYYDGLLQGRFSEPKSDYWIEHSARAKIQFQPEGVLISGASGFYIPRKRAGSTKYRLRVWLQKRYKLLVLVCDKLLRLSVPHALSSFITYDMAYDYIMQRHPPIDYDEYDENAYRFDTSQLCPIFKTSKELKKNWFLKHNYLPDGNIFLAAYYHAIFTHFLNGDVKRYLEIGAGNGNLASFFKRYSKSNVVIIDLPEIILYSCCYLKSIFPDVVILLPNEITSPLTEEKLDKNDFIFLVPSQSHWLPKKAFDLVANTASIQEMTHAQIHQYFNLVQEVSKKGALWCNVNRVEKFPSKTERPVRAFEFPYHKGNEVLVDQVDRYFRLVQPDDVVIHIERICS